MVGKTEQWLLPVCAACGFDLPNYLQLQLQLRYYVLFAHVIPDAFEFVHFGDALLLGIVWNRGRQVRNTFGF